MSAIKQLFGQTLIYGFSSVIARVLNFLLVPLYTILFIPSEYAIVSEMYTYAAFLMIFGSFGMETTFFRFVESNKYKKLNIFGTAFTFVLANSILLLFLGILFHNKIATIIQHISHPEYVLIFLFIISFDLISIIPFALLRQKNQALKFAVFKTINIILNIFFNIFFLIICPFLVEKELLLNFIYLIYDPSISITYVFISNLIASILTLLLLVPEIKGNINKPNYRVFKKMLNYAWPIFIAGLAFMINESIDKLLIKYLLPKGIAMRELGIYSACYKLSIFMTLFVQAYRFAAEPFFFSQFKKPNSKKTYSLMLEVFVLVALVIFLFVTLYIDIIKLIIPNTLYHEVIIIIPIVLLANIFLGIYYNLSVWYKVTNKTKYAAIISIIGAAVTIVLNLLFIPKYGYIGAAWVTLICYTVMMFTSYYLGQKNYKINYNYKSILFYFILAGLLLYISTLFNHPIWMNIQIDNTILFGLYIIFIYSQFKRILKENKFTDI
ncbi:MAG: polysaccharide biosynthesis protein [Flavobacteriales bacterium]|nr:polysaccharide biosynthesis protein [Flavobacteriales bacterium]